MIKTSSPSNQLVCKLNESAPSILRQVLQENGWLLYDEETMTESSWHLNWKGTRYTKSEYVLCKNYQKMNHFPGTGIITRKEELCRLFKQLRCVYGNIYNFTPQSFCVPNEYKKFLREYQLDADKGEKTVWISKPADLSRGRGIYLFKDLHELTYDCNTIVQRYIANPLLISGFKFDLRCYVLVRSYNPLIVYLYTDGLARFATEPYDLSTLGNSYSHLTNTSINILSPSLDQEKDEVGPGCKWNFDRLRGFMTEKKIDMDKIWKMIKGQILLTLAPISQQIPKCADGLFELYGFDFLIDQNLNTYLLEVNLSPSLAIDSDIDVAVKKGLVTDILLLLDFKIEDGSLKTEESKNGRKKKSSIYSPSRIGRFERLYPYTSHQDQTKSDIGLKKLIGLIKTTFFNSINING